MPGLALAGRPLAAMAATAASLAWSPIDGAHAQCLLANPSFEVPGSGGELFAGWRHFGRVAAHDEAPHGAAAARMSGPDTGAWAVSACWQRLDATPGEVWTASACAWHGAGAPLGGESRAILNVEWRDASGALIDYESHAVLDAATPVERLVTVVVQSSPAPPGTESVHVLLGILQGPDDPAADVFFDLARFDSQGPPGFDELQWLDFPGGRTLDFSGRSWRVKGPGVYHPGPDVYCDAASCVWVDAGGRLHLTIDDVDGEWASTEIAATEPLGYGDYVFTTVGRLDALEPSVVLGMFLWQYGPCYDPADGWWNPYDEIDVEFARWGDPAAEIGQFVVQPYDAPGNLSRFDAAFSEGERTSHAFRWRPDRVEFRSWRGGPADEAPETTIHTWTYSGIHLPRPEEPRVHVNLWQLGGPPARAHEIVLESFAFVAWEDDEELGAGVVSEPGRDPVIAAPTPFRRGTTIRFRPRRGGDAQVDVHDAGGRRVRSIHLRVRRGETVSALWDGRDDAGRRSAPGVYLVRIRIGETLSTGRTVLLE